MSSAEPMGASHKPAAYSTVSPYLVVATTRGEAN